MVRKWSYLTRYISLKAKSIKICKILPRVHVLKVFKSKTRFKKAYFNYKTRFFRLTYRRRKHKSNWLTYSIILASWVKSFLKYRQFLRFYQNLGLLNYQFYSSTSNLITRVVAKGKNSLIFNSFSCPNKLVNLFLPSLVSPRLPLIQYSGTLFNSKNFIEESITLNPGLLSSDNLLYSFEITQDGKFSISIPGLKTYTRLINLKLWVSFKYLICIYSVLIYLSLNNTLSKDF